MRAPVAPESYQPRAAAVTFAFSLESRCTTVETTPVEFVRIAALLKPFLATAADAHLTLSHAQLKQISDYLDLLR
ncbi:MAG: hypothetical protein JOY79_02910, partial [Acidobacteriaceae bacterium]|nr:hypothetical protein [Acidobacteriaceae bacterium]